MSGELGASFKILPWDLNYIPPSFVCFVFPLGIFIPPCIGVGGWDSCLSLHTILLIL